MGWKGGSNSKMVKINYLSSVFTVCDKTNMKGIYVRAYNIFARHCITKIKFDKGSVKGYMNFYYMSK